MNKQLFLIRVLMGLLICLIGFYSFTVIKRKCILYSYFHQARWNSLRLEYNQIKKTGYSVLFFGDSMTENFEKYLHETDSIKNMGISGDFSEGLIRRIDNIVKFQPDKVFIMIGINDLIEKVPLAEIENNCLKIIEILKSDCPTTKIYFQSTLPTIGLKSTLSSSAGINKKVKKLNAFLKEASHEKGFVFIDMYSAFVDSKNQLRQELTTDGIHLNEAGYRIWKSFVADDLK